MNDLTCPACGHNHDFNGEQEDLRQDATLDIECPKCHVVYECGFYWTEVFHSEKLKYGSASTLSTGVGTTK